MRQIQTTINVYKFEELDTTAKDDAKSTIIKLFRDGDMFTISTEDDICNLGFTDVELSYSLSYCQGDGLSFTGKISIDKVLNNDYIKRHLDLSNDTIQNILDTIDQVSIYRRNFRYSHCNTCTIVIEGDTSWMSFDDINKLQDTIEKWYKYLCNIYENDGYKWFYEMSDEEAIEICNDNDLEFEENGTIFHKDDYTS